MAEIKEEVEDKQLEKGGLDKLGLDLSEIAFKDEDFFCNGAVAIDAKLAS